MTSKFDELTAKLKEIFQIDKPELDFGIYKIINAKAAMIQSFLANDMKAKVSATLSNKVDAAKKDLEKQLEEMEKNLKAMQVPFSSSPAWVEKTALLHKLNESAAETESQVYAHLLTFFSRYYDNGDFISLRRYKEGQYAIPYSGEEVKLYWANADQYYTKSGENFTNYDFKVDGKKVHFKLVQAAVAKDNIKDSECTRCFALWNAEAAGASDNPDSASDTGQNPLPADFLEVKNGELFIYFVYAKFSKKTKQTQLADEAYKAIAKKLEEMQLLTEFPVLAPAPTQSDKNRTVLMREFSRYMAKNTSDYFIHKNLRKFLTLELDNYIKTEMMHLDDISSAATFDLIADNLRLIQTFRLIALELIGFMAQLEDFQKKLWLKKKFVVQCDYCLTMDRIPEELKAEVYANKAQLEEWKRLGFEGATAADNHPKKSETKQGQQFQSTFDLQDSGNAATSESATTSKAQAKAIADARMVDTKFFDETFKAKLLRSIPDLDDSCDGLIIHSDNFQALNLLQQRYANNISVIYADPPYNAKFSEILYKNNFKHTAWLSMMHNRMSLARNLLQLRGAMVTAIDDNECTHLSEMIISCFPSLHTDCISIIHNPAGVQGDNFSYCHEYALFSYVNNKGVIGRIELDQPTEGPLRDWGPTGKRGPKNCFYPIYVQGNKIVEFGDVCETDFHPSSSNVDCGDGRIAVYPIDEEGEERKWVFARDSVESIKENLFVKSVDGVLYIWRIRREGKIKTVWANDKYYANIHGSKLLNNIIGSKKFDFPKSLYTVMDSISAINISRAADSLVLDYFGGSGTTAHAVIDLNRQDGGKRKYILVEMGEHFDTVLKPRIEKVVYSPDWKAGKPESSDKGISHAFKYMTLESYEDTLGNLKLKEPEKAQMEFLKDEYMLGYMMEIESRDSLLGLDKFAHPFDYTLEIAVDSSGATTPRKVDMVETFNYLIGLKVQMEDRSIAKGWVLVTGELPSGEEALILWRDMGKIGNEELKKILDKQAIHPRDKGFVLYVNGDHNLPNTVKDNGVEKTIKVRSIEAEFNRHMFEEA